MDYSIISRCSECGKKGTTKRIIDKATKICNECSKIIDVNKSQNGDNTLMNTQTTYQNDNLMNSMLYTNPGSLNFGNTQFPAPPSFNPILTSSQPFANQSHSSPFDDNAYWTKLDTFFDRKLSKFSEEFEEKVTKSVKEKLVDPLTERVELLETSNKLKDEKLETLTSIVINQQKTLSKLERLTSTVINQQKTLSKLDTLTSIVINQQKTLSKLERLTLIVINQQKTLSKLETLTSIVINQQKTLSKLETLTSIVINQQKTLSKLER